MSRIIAQLLTVILHRDAGSYSFVAVGAKAATYDLLAKPVHRRILFAGEHTCKVSQYFSAITQACKHSVGTSAL